MTNKLFKIAGLGVAVAMCISFAGNENTQKSAGAPMCVTNAPGEQTCSGKEGTKSCHSGGIADNSGPGTPSILFSGGSIYVPGETYTITAMINHPISNRFGFEMVSLKDSNNAFTGSIALIDPTKTQTEQSATCSFPDRVYVTHQLAGTYPTTTHLGQWTYQWTAPSYNAGNISFYACFLAADNNNTNDPGDETYWKKITITPSAVGIAENKSGNIHVAVYPNPCSEYVYLCYYLYQPVSVKAELLSTEGKLVQTLISERNASGSYTEKVAIQDLPKGMYLIRSTVGKREKVDRVYLQ